MRDGTSATPAAASTILAIDLGKFRSVACRYDPATGGHAFEAVATTPSAVHDLLVEAHPQLLVVEACNVCAWRACGRSRRSARASPSWS